MFEGMSRFRSFTYGQLSAVVEPVAAVFGSVVVLLVRPLLPFALAFAAGAMVFVVIEEVIPESLHHGFEGTATSGFLTGFLIMMILDVGLGEGEGTGAGCESWPNVKNREHSAAFFPK